jgi:hypothetical protein
MNIKEFIYNNRLTLDIIPVDHNPRDNDNEVWKDFMHHICILRSPAESCHFAYSVGRLYDGELDIENVLESLQRDCETGEVSFEEFCYSCGYDTDSKKAENIHKDCKKVVKDFRRVLGNQYDTFLEIEF